MTQQNKVFNKVILFQSFSFYLNIKLFLQTKFALKVKGPRTFPAIKVIELKLKAGRSNFIGGCTVYLPPQIRFNARSKISTKIWHLKIALLSYLRSITTITGNVPSPLKTFVHANFHFATFHSFTLCRKNVLQFENIFCISKMFIVIF